MGTCCTKNPKPKSQSLPPSAGPDKIQTEVNTQTLPFKNLNETGANSQIHHISHISHIDNPRSSNKNNDHDVICRDSLVSEKYEAKVNISASDVQNSQVEIKQSKKKDVPVFFGRMPSNNNFQQVNEDAIIMINGYFFGFENEKSQIVKFDPINQSFESIIPPSNMDIFNFSSVTYLHESNIIIAGGLRDEVTVANKVYKYNGTLNIAEELPSFKVKRFAHQATYYNDNFYIVGGIDQNHHSLHSCEKYNFKEKQWYRLPDLNINRAFGNLLIYDKEIYLFGGTTGALKETDLKASVGQEETHLIDPSKYQHSRKIEKLDLSLNKWVILDIKLPMGIDNTFVCSYAADEIQIIGGQTEFLCLNANIVLNLKTGCYTMKKFMKNERVAHKGMVHETKIWIFGGDAEDTIEQYDIIRDEWQQQVSSHRSIINEVQTYSCATIPLFIKKSDFESVRSTNITNDRGKSIDNECFLFGDDYSPFILNINYTKRSIKEYSVPCNLRLLGYQGVCKLKDGRYFFNGGMDSTNSYISNRTMIYVPQENKVIKTTKSIYNRYTFNILQKGNYVYAIGGRFWGGDEIAIIKSCERYNLSSHIWEKIADLNESRCSSMSLIHQDKIYVAGGYGKNQERCTTIERYCDTKNLWEKINVELVVKVEVEPNTSMISSGLEGSYVIPSDVPGNYIFICGRSDANDTDKVWQFDIQKGGTWEIGTLKDSKSLHKVHIIGDGKICIFGGESTVVEFFDIHEGRSYEDDFGLEIDKMISKQFYITGREGNTRLIRQSLA